jgi:ABC-type uncharacterized transport system substrate-binding protein
VRRRELITLLGGAAAWPLAARAQQAAMPVIGFLNSASPGNYVPMVAAFRQGLKEAGYVEGQNVAVEYRWAEGQYDRVPVIALELVDRRVAVLVANTPGVLAVKAAITTTPIVFTTASDPVQIGLVASMSRPSGNVTGATTMGVELASKLLELAHELVPTASVIAALINPANSSAEPQLRGLQAAARTLGVQLHVVHASSERDFGMVFANLAELRPGALVIAKDIRSKCCGPAAIPAVAARLGTLSARLSLRDRARQIPSTHRCAASAPAAARAPRTAAPQPRRRAE